MTPFTADRRTDLAALSIVTALVNGTQLPIACPATWCNWDHAGADTTAYIEDVDHTGDNVDLMVPDFMNGDDQLFAFAYLGQDLYASDERRTPHIRIEDGGGEASYLTPAQGLKFADRATAWADRIRSLIQKASVTSSTAPGHKTWCAPGGCEPKVCADGTPYTEHYGAKSTAIIGDGHFEIVLNAQLGVDEAFQDPEPSVFLESPGMEEGVFLAGADLDNAISQLSALLGDLRVMRTQIGGEA